MKSARCRRTLIVAALCAGLAASGSATAPVAGVSGCAAPVGDVLAGGAIDPERVGFTLRALGPAFELLSIGLRGEGTCDVTAEEPAPAPSLILDSSWRERESGASVTVSQRRGELLAPHVLESHFSSFAVDGSSFSVWAQGSDLPPGPLVRVSAAQALAPVRRAAAIAAPPREATDDATALLERVVHELAPELSLACFFRRAEGGWDDLAAARLGDPRPALPVDFFETSFTLQFLARPASSCPPPAVDPGDGLSFWASFADGGNGWVSLGAWAQPPGSTASPGRLAADSASWISGPRAFSVSAARSDQPLGLAAIRALALAMDPGFATACLLRDHTLVGPDLAALGLRAATPPAGYREMFATLRAEELSGVCPPDLAYSGGVFLDWLFVAREERFIAAQAVRFTGSTIGPGGPIKPQRVGAPDRGGGGTSPTEPAFFAWSDAAGTSYTVYGYSASGAEPPSRGELLFVALSLDPTFTGE